MLCYCIAACSHLSNHKIRASAAAAAAEEETRDKATVAAPAAEIVCVSLDCEIGVKSQKKTTQLQMVDRRSERARETERKQIVIVVGLSIYSRPRRLHTVAKWSTGQFSNVTRVQVALSLVYYILYRLRHQQCGRCITLHTTQIQFVYCCYYRFIVRISDRSNTIVSIVCTHIMLNVALRRYSNLLLHAKHMTTRCEWENLFDWPVYYYHFGYYRKLCGFPVIQPHQLEWLKWTSNKNVLYSTNAKLMTNTYTLTHTLTSQLQTECLQFTIYRNENDVKQNKQKH